MRQPNGIVWQNDADIVSWTEAATTQLNCVLGHLLGGGLSIHCQAPDAAAARKHISENLDLLGAMALGWGGLPNSPLRLQIPLPFHGVFVKRQPKAGSAGLAVWGSWLGERTGFRYFPKHGHPEEVFWRVGLRGGGYVQAVCGPLSDEERQKAFPKRFRLLASRDKWPSFLERVYDLNGSLDLPEPEVGENGSGFWGLVHDLATKNYFDTRPAPSEEDDLNHRVLVTFPVWLKTRLIEALIITLLEISGDEANEVAQAIKRQEPLNVGLARSLWQRLSDKDQLAALAMRLRPRGWSLGPAEEGETRFVPLQWIEAVSSVDLAALLTQVRRYPMPQSVLGNLTAQYRQNHPSFRGCICPVQSPESELVGLSLHLARGAKVDWDGRIYPADGSQPHEELGFGAGLVPFYQHNDGARCMMGAKNLRQAVPLLKGRAPVVKTGGEQAVLDFVRPLTEIGICPSGTDDKGDLALGVDLLVAYLPWKGMNVDDAIVVGEQAVTEGILDFQISERFKVPLEPGWRIDRLARQGSTLFGGDLIASFELPGGKKDAKREFIYKDRSPATVMSIHFPEIPEWMGGNLTFELVKHLKLGPGDKLMGRHGNKGVIGAILPRNKMPRLPEDSKLPPEMRGRPIDVLLNPHGVISRMNLGQLLETHVGWLLKTGCKPEQLIKDGASGDTPLGQAFLDTLDHAKIQALLEAAGLDSFGRIQLVLPGNTRTLAPVVVGFQHIVRLKHVPELKAQARRGGEGAIYSRDTGQAIHGRILGGGQRVGEMEVWAFAGHQAGHILEEMLGAKADSMLTRDLLAAEQRKSPGTFEGFSQRLRDWLFALLIDLPAGGDKLGFSIIDANAARKKIGEDKRVLTSESVRKMVLASFSCHSKKQGGCPFELLGGERIAVAEPSAGSDQVTVKLEELLAHLGFEADGPLRRKGLGYYLRLRARIGTQTDGLLQADFDLEHDRVAHAQGFARPAGELKVTFDSEDDQVKATITPAPNNAPPNWPDSLKEVPLYAQFPRPSSMFSIGDISDLPRLAARLNEHSDAVSSRLWDRLPNEAKIHLKNGADPAALAESLIAGLNEVVVGPSIYEAQLFESVRLRPETRKLMDSKLRGRSLRRLNRLLLEDAYPGMFLQDNQRASGESRNMDSCLVLREFLKHDGRRRLGQMNVACPKEHKTIPLKGKAPFGEKLDVAPGGFFDQNIFGSFKAAGTTDDRKNWAFIELPIEAPYPVESFFGPSENVNRILKKHGIQRASLPALKVIPVLPPRYRMPFMGAERAAQNELVQDGYAPLLRACRNYERAEGEESKAKAARLLNRAVHDLFRLLAGRLSGKDGLIRHHGLGRRVDRSGRLVIIPNPQLRWDEAGVPTAILLEIMGDELKRWMKEMRESGDLVEMASVALDDKGDTELIESWSWRKSAKDKLLLEQGYELICRFIKAHPDVLIVLNRQPSLHRDSVQAFHPKPLHPDAGDVLQLSPLVCRGFGADFDGDEMAIHVPLSPEARAEAKRMLPSENVLSLATGEVLPGEKEQDRERIESRRGLGLSEKRLGVLAQFDQDFVLGLYWASREESGLKQRLLEILPGACCRGYVEKLVLDQNRGADLLEHVVRHHRPVAPETIWKLSNFAYECCSNVGVSFGFYELNELWKICRDDSVKALKAFAAERPEGVNQSLSKLVQEPLANLVGGHATSRGPALFERPGLHFAAMALSGARGKQQVRQLVGGRGFLSPGNVDCVCTPESFRIRSALVQGMTAEEAFFGAMNSRSSMCDKKLGTRQAGYLTRRLITALWPIRVVEEDCGSTAESRNPISCLCPEGLCAACYGNFPDETRPDKGFPAGLIAAQSIGERGTQLSMQSFHTGQKVFTMDDVRRWLDRCGERYGFSNGDLLDLPALVTRFRQPGELDRISLFLTARVWEKTRVLLETYTGGRNWRVEHAVLGILNRALTKSIYDPERFRGIELSPEIHDLIEADEKAQAIAEQSGSPVLPCVGLNRMLLESAYPRELAKRDRFFYHQHFAQDFVRAMKAVDAYRSLDDRHLQILWRAIHKSPEKSLRSVTKTGGLFTRITFEQQLRHILLAACRNESGSLSEPAARVLFNFFGTRDRVMKGKMK